MKNGTLAPGWLERTLEEEKKRWATSIPVDLAKGITGYSHEETPKIIFDNFVKPTFFQRVFGR